MMKNYLMLSIAAIAIGSAFTSCNKNDFEPTTEDQIREAKYIQAFKDAFSISDINSNVNWGFNDQSVVSFDKDGKFTSITRGVDANNNQWGKYVEVPSQLTEAQKNKVTKFFSEKKNPTGVAVNWSDFFVQQVSSREPYAKNMNYLYCGSTVDHTNDFNAGDGGGIKNVCVGLSNPNDINSTIMENYDGIEFMVGSSTEYFAFHNSYDSQFYNDNYVIIPGETINAAYPEEPSVAGMWFVGFDYQHDKTKTSASDNDIVERDYYFNDWIVKITPGIYKNAQRIMVEDLIANNLSQVQKSDWDFNDAVFDVAFVSEWSNNIEQTKAIVTLYAAGGTKPLTVGGVEVHEALGVNVSDMTNTKKGGKTAPVAIFRVPATSRNAKDIKVLVNGNIELTAEQGKAPQKIETSTSTRWLQEKKIITSGYANFAEYILNNAPKDWYNTITDNSVLY